MKVLPQQWAANARRHTGRLSRIAWLETVPGHHLGRSRVQAMGRQPHPASRALDGVPAHQGRYRPEQTALYRLVQQQAATFLDQAEVAAGAN